MKKFVLIGVIIADLFAQVMLINVEICRWAGSFRLGARYAHFQLKMHEIENAQFFYCFKGSSSRPPFGARLKELFR